METNPSVWRIRTGPDSSDQGGGRMINELFRLDGKRALVTGGSRGIGKEAALILSAAGASVAITSRSQAAADLAAEEISAQTGGQVLGIEADAGDEAKAIEAIAKTVARFGGLEILVNNAGVNKRYPIEHYPSEDWTWVVGVNLHGPFFYTKHAIPHMKRCGWGRIINVGSVQTFVSLPERGAYGATKSGLWGMTRAVALELATEKITANILCPGPVDTDINAAQKANVEAYKLSLSRTPMGRWARPDEMRGPLLFLASEASSFMTGQSLVVDGGWNTW